jgi:hypothetical protein
MKKGCPKSSLACKIFWWALKFSSQTIPKANHLLAAAGQLKKRRSAVSYSLLWHITQLYPSSNTFLLLLKIFLVFDLSLRSSQAKNLIFGIHLVFHISRIALLGLSSPNW